MYMQLRECNCDDDDNNNNAIIMSLIIESKRSKERRSLQKREKYGILKTYFLVLFDLFPDVVNNHWQRSAWPKIAGHALVFQLFSIAFGYYAASND